MPLRKMTALLGSAVLLISAGALTAGAAQESGLADKPYTISETVAMTVSANGKKYDLHEKALFVDLNGDDKFTSADARLLLRMAAKLDPLPEEIAPIDLNGDGRFQSTDARLALRYTARLDKYYCTAEDEIVSGFVKKENGKTAYLNAIGNFTYGDVEIGGKTYRFNPQGEMVTGWVNSGLDSYNYGSDGALRKSTADVNFTYDANGVASAKTLNHDTFHVYLCGILKRNGASVESIYRYVNGNFRYKYYDKGAPEDMAIRILKNGRGACYDFANLTKYLLEAAGYECRIVVGDSFNPNNGSEHDWVLVKVNGVWRHMDTQRGYYLKTDAQMRAAGYGWNSSGLPAAV
ncbi:MAG: hypothetical protein IJ766_02155 [Clostridia bacterium]|nr:hypothetical protein [Clostridia bacterium]